MPEFAEVKIIAEQLNNKFKGEKLQYLHFSGGRYLNYAEKYEFIKEYVDQVSSYGKALFWDFPHYCIYNSLGMSGYYGPPDKHTAVSLEFLNDRIHFNDIRHFGFIKIISPDEKQKIINKLGIPLDQANKFYMINFNSSKTLAEFLMNQSNFAGIGNYLKAEILFEAKLSPHRLANSLSIEEKNTLLKAVSTISDQAYRAGGATFKTYQHLEGKGNFASQFKVYGKKTYQNFNVKKEQTKDKRTTHWIPELQK